VLTWSPLAAGFVADDFDLDSLEADDFRRSHPFASLDLGPLRSTLASIGACHQRSAAQVALAWVLSQPAVAGAIVGIRSEGEANQLPGAADLRLSETELEEIESAIP
jgi:aryl-alcohol dehydrogenase-like predicted oxidoreductase